MRKLLFITLISFVGLSIKAQSELDSLWGVWKDKTRADTIRLEAIGNFIWDGYLYTKPDSAFYFAQMQYDFAQIKGLKKQLLEPLNIQGISFYIRGDFAKALGYYKKGSLIAEDLGDKSAMAGSLNNIGIIYLDQGDYPKALEYFQKSLVLKKELDDKSGVARTLLNIGIIYSDQENYDKALEYYQKGLEMHQKIGDESGIANSLNNMGEIYNDLGNAPQALEHYQRSLEIKREIGDKRGIASSLNNIGIIYEQQGNYDRALEYYQNSLAIKKEVSKKSGVASSLNIIGMLYSKQGDYSNALDYCQRGLKLAEEIKVLVPQKSACECLYDTYKAMGKGNQALGYLEKIQVFDDSLKAEETTKKLQQMEFAKMVYQDSLETVERERQVDLAHQEEVRKEKQTRNGFIIGGILALILAGGFYSRWRYVQKSKAIIESERDRSDNLLLNILPEEIAQELKEKGKADARDFDMVSILFTDFKGFTEQSAKLSAADLVREINHCFEAFDGIIDKYDVEKIKTIGDAYMAAGGLPVPTDDSVKKTVLAALEMQSFICKRKSEMDDVGKPAFEMRVGIHTGPVVAGIVGVKKFQYDIWGDTVNTASRMESSGAVGQVNISEATYNLLKGDPQLAFENRGKIKAKGKGELEMYFVSKA